MGYKEQFIDYKSMSYEDVQKLEQQRLAKLKEENPTRFAKEIEKIKRRKEQLRNGKKLTYKKEMDKKEKVLLAKALQDGNNPFVAYHNNNSIIDKIAYDIQVTDYHHAIQWMMHINLATFLGLDVRRRENFQCGIIQGNVASINYDNEGNWRYFTRNKEETEGYVLGIIDLTEIMYNLNYHQALDKLCDMALIHVEEAKWLKSEKSRYTENVRQIQDAEKEMGKEYPKLYSYIKKHLYVLEELNKHGISKITTEEKSVKGMDIFFASTRHIKEQLAERGIKKSYTNINKLINMFVAIGLVTKVHLNQVPERFQEETKKFQKIKSSQVVKGYEQERKNCHTITFYQLPAMTAENLSEAQRRVIRLKGEGIKATGVNISSLELKKALGDILYNKLFPKEKVMIVKGIEKAKAIQREGKKKEVANKLINV